MAPVVSHRCGPNTCWVRSADKRPAPDKQCYRRCSRSNLSYMEKCVCVQASRGVLWAMPAAQLVLLLLFSLDAWWHFWYSGSLYIVCLIVGERQLLPAELRRALCKCCAKLEVKQCSAAKDTALSWKPYWMTAMHLNVVKIAGSWPRPGLAIQHWSQCSTMSFDDMHDWQHF